MPERKNFLFEWRTDVARVGAPIYVEFGALEELQGFQSVFGVTRAQAAANTARGDTKGAQYAVYCDILLIDFDNAPAAADRLEHRLIGDGTAFLRAHSGGRSDHFHIPIRPMFGPDVAYSCRQWVAANAPGADVSPFHRNGMFRLMGTRHKKTGKPKREVRRQRGSALAIPIVEEPRAWERISGTEPVGDLAAALTQILSLIQCPPTVGNRHQCLWSAARSLLDAAGEVIDGREAFALDLLRMINSTFPEPKPEADLRRIASDLRKP